MEKKIKQEKGGDGNVFLTPIKKLKAPLKIISLDIETYSNKNIFYIVGFYHEEKGEEYFKYFYDQEEAIKYIESQPEKTIFYATNLGFDITGLLFPKNWNKCDYAIRGGEIILAFHKDLKLSFSDTMNYVKFSVKKQGEILNIPKLEAPSFWKKIYNDKKEVIGYDVEIPKNKKEELELLEYNYRDCQVTYKFIKFLEEELLLLNTNLESTIAKTSLNHFRRNYLKEKIRREETTKKGVEQLIFKSYYGGRTEIYIQGTHILNDYDVNSLYPSEMLEDIPNPNTFQYVYVPKQKNILKYEGVSTVKIITPKKLYYPLLPFRKDGKLIFPLGTFTATYTHLELRKALSLGYEIKYVEEQIIYKKSVPFFKEYVLDLYNKRLEQKGRPEEIVYKLLLNSLYGKFAERPITKTWFLTDIEIEDIIDKNSNTENIKFYEQYGYYETESNEEKQYKLPIFSSYITSKARIRMYENLSNVYYMDTDSYFTPRIMNTGSKLGELKLEAKGECTLVKPKFYQFKTVNKTFVKVKGLSKANTEQFKDLLLGKKVEYLKFVKLKEALIQNLNVRSIKTQEKGYDLVDNKRTWFGGFSTPLIIEDES